MSEVADINVHIFIPCSRTTVSLFMVSNKYSILTRLPIRPLTYSPIRSIRQPIANKRLNPMRVGTEPPQLHPLPALNLLGVAVPPLHRHLRVRVGVDQHVEGAVARELREESHRGRDLAEDGGDLGLDLLFRLFGVSGRCRGVRAVLVGCCWGRWGAAGRLGDLDLVVLGM